MKYDFNKVQDRIGSDSIKWEKQLKFGTKTGLLPFWIADTDFATLPEAVEAMKKRLEHPVFGYTTTGERTLETVRGWYKRRHQVDLPVSAFSPSEGVVTSIWFSIRGFTQPGDGVLVFTPVYDPFFAVINNQGRKQVDCPLVYSEGRYTIDWEDLEKKLSGGDVKAMIFCNPHNPVGRVWTKEELIKVAEICKKNNTILVGDEIHGDIVYGEHKHTPLFSLSDDLTDNIVVMGSPSKTFNLACFYSAYVVIKNKALRDQYNVVYDDFHFDYNYLGIEALMACYNECDYYVDQQNEYFWKNIGVVRDFLAENMPEVKMIEPEGTYLLWIDFSAWNMEQDDLMNAFAEAGVRLNSGTNYGECGKGYVRLNVATQTAVLKKGLECIKVARDSHMA